MKWGLVIQGPLVTYGQGPNNVDSGFSAFSTIKTNLSNFYPFVDAIVLSTWEGSDPKFSNEEYNNFVVIENKLPVTRDPDNRRKQFITTLEGCKYLSLNTDITHILKIRTDQIINPSIIEWLNSFFDVSNNKNRVGYEFQQDYLVFSDMLTENPFYMGDFIFAGTKKDMISFCSANLEFTYKNLHPSIGTDYILKYFSLRDVNFWKYFFKKIPLFFQVSNIKNQIAKEYWLKIKRNCISVMPGIYFESIIWRGKLMTKVLPNYKNSFSFYNDWLNDSESDLINTEVKKSLWHLLPSIDLLVRAKYEYFLYWKKLLKFHFKKNKQ